MNTNSEHWSSVVLEVMLCPYTAIILFFKQFYFRLVNTKSSGLALPLGKVLLIAEQHHLQYYCRFVSMVL